MAAAAIVGTRRGAQSNLRRTSLGSSAGIEQGLAQEHGRQYRKGPKGTKERIKEALVKKPYRVQDYYWQTGIWQSIAVNHHFEHATLAVIGFNSIWIWIDTDWNKATTLLEAHWVFQVGEQFFCLFFSFEWLVRFMSFRRKRDGLKDKWFAFDSVLVGMMVVETWVITAYLAAAGGSSGANLGTASVLRLFRLLRLTRMARMLRSMPELMILIKGMVSAMRSVATVMCLLIIVMYVFGIAMTQLAAGSAVGDAYFDGVGTSMYTLLVYGVFLDSISTLSNDIGKQEDFYGYVLVTLLFAFVLVATLTVLNMLIGVLCEVVSRVAEKERHDMDVACVTSKLKGVLKELDKDGDERISQTEFEALLGDITAARALKEVQVDPSELVDSVDYIFEKAEVNDAEELPSLSFEDFMTVVLTLRGSNTAKVKDIVSFRKSVEKAFKEFTTFLEVPQASKAIAKSPLKRMSSRISRDARCQGNSVLSQHGSHDSLFANGSPAYPPARRDSEFGAPPHSPPAMAGKSPSQDLWQGIPAEQLAPSSSRPSSRSDTILERSKSPSQPPERARTSHASTQERRSSLQDCRSHVEDETRSENQEESARELSNLQARTARLEGMLIEVMKEVRCLGTRIQSQQLQARHSCASGGIADSTGGPLYQD